MATAVFFHAHPDDEAIATSGTMMLAKAAGHRVVLVVATRGEQGEPVAGVLRPGELLGARRAEETVRAGEIIGADRIVFLDYEDSGMIGEVTNENPACFWQADLAEAVDRFGEILGQESADVLTVYDSNGGYGHPDHIQVHRVGVKAAERCGVARVFESTMNRTRIAAMMDAALEDGSIPEEELEQRRAMVEEGTFGMLEEHLTHAIDVSSVIDRKKAAMMAHESQIDDESFFLQMPHDVFAESFGSGWFRDRSAPRNGAALRTDLFHGLP